MINLDLKFLLKKTFSGVDYKSSLLRKDNVT